MQAARQRNGKEESSTRHPMNKATQFLRSLMPILAAAYGTAIIYVTAMPVAGDNPGFTGELLTWLSGSRRAVFQADGHLPPSAVAAHRSPSVW